jgi:5-methylcytosine-specific restriction endonuclease McrA
MTPEHKQKIGQANRGRKRTLEAKIKMSKSQKGNKNALGVERSEEFKNKIRLANLGEKNPLWRGGRSFKPYTTDWTETLKRSIRERDHYTCQLCGEIQSKEALSIHHIDYDKQNCNPNNLISLCRTCHLKTNHNREYWKKSLRMTEANY